MSQRKITLDRGQHRVKTIWIAHAAPMIVTAVTLMDVPDRRMRSSFQQRYELRLIRLTEYFAQAKQQQLQSLQLESPQLYRLGNAEGLWLCPKLHGDSYTYFRRV